MSVSPSYQMSYSSLPFASPGKLSGLTFKLQFYNAFQAQPDYLFISSWNEWIAQPQPNPYPSVSTAFDMGLPTDSLSASSLFVDAYGWEFSRDIEPSARYGSYIYNLMSSCVQIFKSGATTCNNPSALCCQSSNYFTNVYSLKSTSIVSFTDYLVSTSPSEVQSLITAATYAQICTPFGGTTVFCQGTPPNPQTGPFIIYSQTIYSGLIGIYRCVESTGQHFISIHSNCEGYTSEGLLGYISPTRGRETLRGLYRCLNHTVSAHYHSLDLVCPTSDTDAGLLGYVR